VTTAYRFNANLEIAGLEGLDHIRAGYRFASDDSRLAWEVLALYRGSLSRIPPDGAIPQVRREATGWKLGLYHPETGDLLAAYELRLIG
jgi:hypothetical protein